MNEEKTDSKKDKKESHPPVRPSLEIKIDRHGSKDDVGQKGFMTLSYIAAVLCVLVGGVYVYTSQAAKEPAYPVPVSTSVLRSTPEPIQREEPVVEPPAIMTPEVNKPLFRPTAVVDVPGVGLRKLPDTDAKARPGLIRKGEGVVVIGRSTSSGPDWVKIRTESGKIGWVLASVLKDWKQK